MRRVDNRNSCTNIMYIVIIIDYTIITRQELLPWAKEEFQCFLYLAYEFFASVEFVCARHL